MKSRPRLAKRTGDAFPVWGYEGTVATFARVRAREMRTQEKELSEQESEFPEAWQPTQAGERIKGILREVRPIDPGGQGVYPCLTLQTADGTKCVHAFRSVLKRELARARPKVGDELEIVYHGEREGGAYGKYHSYRVLGGQVAEYDWSQDLPEEERGRLAPAGAGVPIAATPPPALNPNGTWAPDTPSPPAPPAVPVAPDDDLPF